MSMEIQSAMHSKDLKWSVVIMYICLWYLFLQNSECDTPLGFFVNDVSQFKYARILIGYVNSYLGVLLLYLC